MQGTLLSVYMTNPRNKRQGDGKILGQ